MNAFTIILNIIPQIIAAMKAIEAAIPIPQAGKDKLDAVINIITGLDSTLVQYVPQIQGVVSILVKVFNATGVFSKPAVTQ